MDLTTQKSHVNLVNTDGNWTSNEEYEDCYDARVKDVRKFRQLKKFQGNIFTPNSK